MENDEEHTQKAAPDAHFEKLAGVGHDGWREQKRRRYLCQTFTEGDIFQDPLIGKTAETLEQRATDEQRLITINDPASGAPDFI